MIFINLTLLILINISTMNDYYDNIKELKLKYRSIKYQNELDDNCDLTDEQKQFLNDKINELQNNNTNSTNVNKQSGEKQTMFTDVDKYIYQRQWNKLKSFHQKKKLKEYIDSLNITDDTLVKKLYDAVDSKFLSKKCNVIYDTSECKITNVAGLLFNKKKNKYEFNAKI